MSIFLIVLLLVVAYAPCSIGFSLPVNRLLRAVAALLLFLLAIGIQIVLFTGILPRAVLLPAAWLSGTMIFATPILFVRDLILLGLHLGRKKLRWKSWQSLALILTVSGLLAFRGECNAVRPPEVKTTEIALPGLPKEFDGFRIIYLSDLHISPVTPSSYLWTVVCRTNARHPDLVLLGGDLGDMRPEHIPSMMHQLGDIHAKYGVYSSPGNHEYIHGLEDWIAFLDSVGIETLMNRHVVIERDGAKLVVAGLPDEMRDNPIFKGRERPDMAQTLAGAPEGAPVILLAHQPREAREHAAEGASLQLSGHTHGGMIAFFGSLPVKVFNRGFVSGLYYVNGMKLYVTNGAGLWNGFLFRLGVPSEISEIVLRSPDVIVGGRQEPAPALAD